VKINIGLIDVDLLFNKTRHPNLALMKMSGYYKRISDQYDVELIYTNEQLDDLESYDFILASKVFTFSQIPPQLQQLMNKTKQTVESCGLDVYSTIIQHKSNKPGVVTILLGGTGFYDDHGPRLYEDIEHAMPDYHLYDAFVQSKIDSGWKPSYFSDYMNYSIGFTTRGCTRHCSFCVNRNSKGCYRHSPVSEFLDYERKGIYLWDDNFFAYRGDWRSILDDLEATKKPFQFRQGLDIRFLNEERAEKLSRCHYHGDFIFAFDHIQDQKLIIKKLSIWRKYCSKETKLYLLCAYDSYTDDPKYAICGDYTQDEKDLIDLLNTFKRIHILMTFGCLPYIMRYQTYSESKYAGVYTQLARWCNQPKFYKNMSFREFCEQNQKATKTNIVCAPMRAFNLLIDDDSRFIPYVDLKMKEVRGTDYESLS